MAEVITKNGAILPLNSSGNTTFGLNEGVAVTVAKAYALADRHFTIAPHDGQYFLQDLESGLGTTVNDAPVSNRVLHHGDRIRAGLLELVFSDPGPQSQATPPQADQAPVSNQANGGAAPTVDVKQEEAAPSKGLLGFSFGRKKRPKLVLPAVKKKPLPKPLIQREVIRIHVKPDPNNPPKTMINRLLGRTKRKQQLPELKLESINEKIAPPKVVNKDAAATPKKRTPPQRKAGPPSKFEQARLKQQARFGQAGNEQEKLEQAKLEQAKLEQAKLEQAKLEQAKLEQAKLEQAKLEQAKLEQAKLEQAKLEQAKLEQAKLEQ
ncbi:MAG: pSer/pThr/pTyr-binding forkhead associated (FHA) protein, partial [Verrucomicrobiales bacterium]